MGTFAILKKSLVVTAIYFTESAQLRSGSGIFVAQSAA